MGVIFIFVDGIGIGLHSDQNPFSVKKYNALSELINSTWLDASAREVAATGHVFIPVDARLDVDGLPQSGTGQTALFTGINAAKHIGKHFGPFPHSQIKPFLQKKSLFHQVLSAGSKAAFLNAYPPLFFKRAEARNRWSCTTLMTKSAGLDIRTEHHVRNGKGVTAELFGDYWREKLGIDLPPRNGRDVAAVILDLAAEYDLVMLEYYLTDKAGHNQDMGFADEVLSRIDSVLKPLLKSLGNHTLLICSDHGNLEDLSTKTHTLNPVPLICVGPGADTFAGAESIMDVTPGIMRLVRKS